MADDDELLRRARELGEQVDEANAQSAKNHQSAYERAAAESVILRRSKAMGASLRKYLGPLGSLLAWLLGLVGKWLHWVCIKAPDKTDQGTSAGHFSAVRTIRNLVISLAVVLSLQVIAKGIYYYSTGFEETVYVTGKQEIETGELYQFGGCTSLPCSTLSDNGKFYLIESSLYFPIMFYPEENVFANIPQQDAACRVEGYGIYFRSLRWLYKSLQLYQHVVDVSCRPYTDLEIRQAVGDGMIVHDE